MRHDGDRQALNPGRRELQPFADGHRVAHPYDVKPRLVVPRNPACDFPHQKVRQRLDRRVLGQAQGRGGGLNSILEAPACDLS